MLEITIKPGDIVSFKVNGSVSMPALVLGVKEGKPFLKGYGYIDKTYSDLEVIGTEKENPELLFWE